MSNSPYIYIQIALMAYLFKLQWDRFSFPSVCCREGTAEHQTGCSCSWVIPPAVPAYGQLQILTFPGLSNFWNPNQSGKSLGVTPVHIKAAWGILYVSATQSVFPNPHTSTESIFALQNCIKPTHCRRSVGSLKNSTNPLLTIEVKLLPGHTIFHTPNDCWN